MVTQNNASDSLPISGQPLSDEVQSNPNTLRLPPLPPIPQLPLKPGSAPCFLSFAHPEFPPLPFSPFPDLTLYQLADDLFIYDDREVDYVRLRAEAQATILTEGVESTVPSSSTQGVVLSGTPSNKLTIERSGDGLVLLTGDLENNTCYALLSKTDLNQQSWQVEDVFRAPPEGPWRRGPFRAALPQKFYVLLKNPPLPMVSVECYCDAVEPGHPGPGQTGKFIISRRACANNTPLVVYWTISGSATVDVDYGLNQAGTATIPALYDSVTVEVTPWYDDVNESPFETVELTLQPAETYYINPRYATAMMKICEGLFVPACLRPYGSIGIDSWELGEDHALLISDNYLSIYDPLNHPGPTWNFTKIWKINGSIEAVQWSSVQGLPDEIKVATVKKSVANFQQGDMFFGYKPVTGSTRIGRIYLSGEQVVSDLAWAVLEQQNPPISETCPVHGGLYLDQTGIFNHDLIVVTGGVGDEEGGNVWRISSAPDHGSANIRRIAAIPNTHLEGVVTLPNDELKYGPWAGKILTGAERLTPPLIYAIVGDGTAANVVSFQLGVAPEDFDIIPQGQNLYCNDPVNNRLIWKVPSWYFEDCIGHVIVTQAGEWGDTPELVIFHWDPEEGRFVRKVICAPQYDANHGVETPSFEHVTFAPIEL